MPFPPMNSAAYVLPPLPLHPPIASNTRPSLAPGAVVHPAGLRTGHAQGSRLQRASVAGLVVVAHLAGLVTLAQLAMRPVIIPELTTISLALIPTEPAVEPLAPAPAQPPAPPVEKVERIEKVEPPPPQAAKPPPPTPQPKPKQAPLPKLTSSPTALRQPEPAPAPAPSAPAEPVAAAPVAQAPATAAPAASTPVTAARFDAAYLNNPSPAYPMLSRRLREEGQVMLRVLVAPDGRPSRIELRTSSGSERLDRAAEDAVGRWRFVPARRGDTEVEAWVLVPIVFKLKGS